MHQLGCSFHHTTECRTDALMSEAYTENGNLAAEAANRFVGDAAIVGIARSRRDHDLFRLQRGQFIQRDRIVAKHLQVRA